MKADIHPTWFPEATVTCGSCSTSFTVGATVPTISTEICSVCHPFFTGQQRIVDTAGQVERFMRRLQTGQEQRTAETDTKKERKRIEQEARRKRRGLEPIAVRKAKAEKEAKLAAKAREREEAKKASEGTEGATDAAPSETPQG